MGTARRFTVLSATVAVMVMIMASAAFAQEKPKIAVYVTSGSDKSMAAKMLSGLGAHKTVGDALAKALSETGKCEAVNLTGDITKAHGAMVEDAQATSIGPQFEVQYLCIVLIRDVKGKTFNMGIGLADASRGQRIASGSAAIDLSDGPGMLKAMAKMALELTAGIVANVALGPSGGGAGAGAGPTPAGQPVQQAASGKSARTVAAVYMSGEEPKGAAGAHMVIGEELAKAMSKGGNNVVNHTEDILKLSAEGQGDTLTKAIGQRFGVPYVCVVEIKEVSGNSYYLNARMVNTETDETINTATAASNLSNSGEMADVAQVIARELAGGIAFAETAPQVEEAIPIQQAQETGSASAVKEIKAARDEKPHGMPRILENGIRLEVGGALGYFFHNPSNKVSGVGDVGVYADLIYAEIVYNVHIGGSRGVIIGNSSILGKYPLGDEIMKVYPLLGVGTIGGRDSEGGPVILGGRIDIGMSEIAYLRSELLFCFGSGSVTLFKIGGGFDMGLVDNKKVYLRPELLYHLRGTEGEGWWHVFDIHVGIGYKW